MYLMEAVYRVTQISNAIDKRLDLPVTSEILHDVYEKLLEMTAAVAEAHLAVQFAMQSVHGVAGDVKPNEKIAIKGGDGV
jgi:hypothetical protein